MDAVLSLDLITWWQGQKAAVQAATIAGSVALVSAIITACVSVTNVVLKDRLDRALARSRDKDAQRELYRRYADPLTTASESLYWRLHEVFDAGGGYFLLPGGGDTRFERYKVQTTEYRVAAMLGWMAGLRKELVLSAAQPDRSVRSMRAALQSVTGALAEGIHIEQATLESLSRLWNVPTPQDVATGRLLHATQKRFLHARGKQDVEALDETSQFELLQSLAQILVDATGCPIPDDTVRQTLSDSIQSLAVREAWIFRDWQDAIGEWMLIESSTGPRRFDVAGYRTFSSEPHNGADLQWRKHLTDLTADLDVDGDPKRDARIAQLGEVYVAVARLLVEFHESEPTRSGIGQPTLEAAKNTVRERGPAKPPRRYRPQFPRRRNS